MCVARPSMSNPLHLLQMLNAWLLPQVGQAQLAPCMHPAAAAAKRPKLAGHCWDRAGPLHQSLQAAELIHHTRQPCLVTMWIRSWMDRPSMPYSNMSLIANGQTFAAS